MIKLNSRINSFCLLLLWTLALFCSCKQEEEYVDRILKKKDDIFMDGLKAVTAGGNKATVINSKEELVASVGEDVAEDERLAGINFANSTLVLDSDTIKYKVQYDNPSYKRTYLTRGLTGAYSFSYYLETQNVDTGDEEQDKITNAKRNFIIGVVVDKLPDGSEVYLDKELNYIDSVKIER